MGRGSWWATADGVAETDKTKRLALTYLVTLYPTALLKLLLSSNSFLMECFSFLRISHDLQTVTAWFLPLPFICLLLPNGSGLLIPGWIKRQEWASWLWFAVLFGSTTHVVCGILVPGPGIEPRPLAVKAPSPNQWTTRESIWINMKISELGAKTLQLLILRPYLQCDWGLL